MSKNTKTRVAADTWVAADKASDASTHATKSTTNSESLPDSLSLFDSTPLVDTTPNFEAALAELEAIVNTMESDELALDLSLSAYKRGTELLQLCQKTLADAEQQIHILTEANQLQTYTNNTNTNE